MLAFGSHDAGGRVVSLHIWWVFALPICLLGWLLGLRVMGLVLPDAFVASLVLVMAVVIAVVTWCVVRHEIGHARGIPASGCIVADRRCLMAEEHLVDGRDGSILSKLRLLRHQAPNVGRMCPACKAVVQVDELDEQLKGLPHEDHVKVLQVVAQQLAQLGGAA